MKKRTILIVFGLLFGSMLLCGLLFHYLTKSMFLNRVDGSLTDCSKAIAEKLGSGLEVQFQDLNCESIYAYLTDHQDTLLWLSPSLDESSIPHPESLLHANGKLSTHRSKRNRALRVLTTPVQLPSGQTFTLVVFRSIQSWQDSMSDSKRGTIITGLLLLALVSTIAKWSLDQSFDPLTRVSKALERVNASQDYSVAISPGETIDGELKSILETIDALRARLEGLNETIRRTLIGVSHELRNPLTVVTADLDLLKNELPQEMRDEVVEETQKAVSKMTALVSDLLLLLRAESGSDKFEMTSVDLIDLVETVVHQVRNKNPEAKVVFLETEERAVPLLLNLHRELTERIVRDLINNGILYSKSEEVQVSVFCENGDKVIVSIKDTGCGIDEVHHEKLFEQFYRLESSRDRISGGVGLGLPLARALARAQNGDLLLSSRLGEGTEVRVIFPIPESPLHTDT